MLVSYKNEHRKLFIMTNQNKAYAYAGVVILFWATVSAVFKISLRHITPYQLLLYSSSISLLILFFIMLKSKKLKIALSIKKKEYFIIFFLGMLNPYLYFIFLFKAYYLLPAQQAQSITYSCPIVMILLSVPILKQKITKKDIFAMITCYIGIYIIVTKGNVFGFQVLDFDGLAFAIASTVVWALYWIINTKINIDPVVILFLNFLFSFPFVVVSCCLCSSLSVDLYGALGAFYVGAFEMGFAFVLWLYALKLAEKKSKIINLTYLSPVFALFFIQLLAGEKIVSSTIIGIIVMIIGLLAQKGKFVRHKKSCCES
jgi:drug/metabolite transporter (DMT)-like permease